MLLLTMFCRLPVGTYSWSDFNTDSHGTVTTKIIAQWKGEEEAHRGLKIWHSDSGTLPGVSFWFLPLEGDVSLYKESWSGHWSNCGSICRRSSTESRGCVYSWEPGSFHGSSHCFIWSPLFVLLFLLCCFFLGCFGFLLACSLGLQTFPIYLQIPKNGYLGQQLPLSSWWAQQWSKKNQPRHKMRFLWSNLHCEIITLMVKNVVPWCGSRSPWTKRNGKLFANQKL